MAKVKSSFIAEMKHDEVRQDLTIKMKTGAEYIYTPVSKKFYDFIQSYESKGEAYHACVRHNKALTALKIVG